MTRLMERSPYKGKNLFLFIMSYGTSSGISIKPPVEFKIKTDSVIIMPSIMTVVWISMSKTALTLNLSSLTYIFYTFKPFL